MKKRGIIKKLISVFAAACFFAPRFCFALQNFNVKTIAAESLSAAERLGTTESLSATESLKVIAVNKKSEFSLGSLVIKTPAGAYEYSYPQLVYNNGELTLLGFENEIDAIYEDNYIAAVNAELIFNPNREKPFCFEREKYGSQIKKQQIRAAIASALSSGKRVIELKAEPIAPDIFYNDVLKKCVLRSSFRTYYGSSCEERKTNVALACAAINGTVIASGGEFSFNAVVGERTEARGYKSAKIILNGEFAEGIGGGVCQVSGTIYNAALLAGLSVTEWHRHSLPVSYLNPSFDAMVSGDFCDLIFKNDTSSELYILCRADGEFLSAQIYGVAREYEYKLISRVVDVIEAKTFEVVAEGLKSGERLQVKQPKNGLKSEGYLCAYKNGELVFSRKIREDEYAAQNGLVKIGKK